MKVGYIRRTKDQNGNERFKYIEGNATRRIGVKTDSIKVKFLYGTHPYEEVESNTKFFDKPDLILVCEPFFTNKELKERCEKWCETMNGLE